MCIFLSCMHILKIFFQTVVCHYLNFILHLLLYCVCMCVYVYGFTYAKVSLSYGNWFFPSIMWVPENPIQVIRCLNLPSQLTSP